ncbi:hypothetical protein UPYG_G00080540 [Umbra pygmaea]|uniref:Uncharacterized protein n=1 Tax=Umbra pygmaea TaxID=75934 RepID=A0ABD0XDK5_UMBPY
MLGDSILESKKWMLSIEGKVLIQPTDHQTDFTSALAVLFTAYYVFNIEYQVEAATTMECIQRFFARINPDYSKCTSKVQVSKKSGKMVQRKASNLNPQVLRFITEFKEFEWQNH